MRDEQAYVVGKITDAVTGAAHPWDWHAFTSATLRDAELDRIRQCAAVVRVPPDAEGRAILLDLLDQADLVSHDDPTRPRAWRVRTGVGLGAIAGVGLYWLYYLPGAGLFDNLHLLLAPPALGAFIVALRNSRKGLGAYDPKIAARNKQGRV